MSRININRILIEKGSDRVKVLKDEILEMLNSIDNSTNPSGYITNAALADYSKTADTVSAVAAGTTANKISVTKNGSTSTITVDNVTNVTKATQDASGNVITTTTYATKAELPKTTIHVRS